MILRHLPTVDAIKQRRDALSAQVTSAEKRLNGAVLQKHITNYLKTKDIYAGYQTSAIPKRTTGNTGMRSLSASKRAFDELLADTSAKLPVPTKQLPSLNALRAEYMNFGDEKGGIPGYYRRKMIPGATDIRQIWLVFRRENVRSAPRREPAGRKISAVRCAAE